MSRYRFERSLKDGLGLARGDEGPERPRNLEAQISAGRIQVLADRAALGAGRPPERVRASPGVNRPLQIEPAAQVIRDVGIDHLGRPAGKRDREFRDVIGARVTPLQRNQRALGCLTSRDREVGGFGARLDLGEAPAVGKPLRNGLV